MSRERDYRRDDRQGRDYDRGRDRDTRDRGEHFTFLLSPLHEFEFNIKIGRDRRSNSRDRDRRDERQETSSLLVRNLIID
jgi:hypothetical protein